MSSNVKNRIFEVASELFLRQGYKKTTIKQIVEISGINPGSIYHFYRNKEDILKQILAGGVTDYRKNIESYYQSKNKTVSDVQMYSAVTMCTFYATELNKNFRSLVFEAYSSSTLIHALVDSATPFNLSYFQKYDPQTTYDLMYLKTLAMHGVVYAYLANLYQSHIPFTNRWRQFIKIALHTYCVSEEEIEQISSDSGISSMLLDVANVVGMNKFFHIQSE